MRLDLRTHIPKFYEHPVHIDVGSYFYVVLDENLSTGFHWESIDSNLQHNDIYKVLKYAGTNYVKCEALPGVTGVGGTRTIRFEVIGSGEGNLELFLSRMDAD